MNKDTKHEHQHGAHNSFYIDKDYNGLMEFTVPVGLKKGGKALDSLKPTRRYYTTVDLRNYLFYFCGSRVRSEHKKKDEIPFSNISYVFPDMTEFGKHKYYTEVICHDRIYKFRFADIHDWYKFTEAFRHVRRSGEQDCLLRTDQYYLKTAIDYLTHRKNNPQANDKDDSFDTYLSEDSDQEGVKKVENMDSLNNTPIDLGARGHIHDVAQSKAVDSHADNSEPQTLVHTQPKVETHNRSLHSEASSNLKGSTTLEGVSIKGQPTLEGVSNVSIGQGPKNPLESPTDRAATGQKHPHDMVEGQIQQKADPNSIQTTTQYSTLESELQQLRQQTEHLKAELIAAKGNAEKENQINSHLERINQEQSEIESKMTSLGAPQKK